MNNHMDKELENYLKMPENTVHEVNHVQPFGIDYEVELKTVEQFIEFHRDCKTLFATKEQKPTIYKTPKRIVFMTHNAAYTYVFE